MNVLTELWLGFAPGEYSATRLLGPDRIAEGAASLERAGLVADGQLTDAGRTCRLGLEDDTDRSQRHLVELLGDHLDDVIAGADAVSTRIVDARSFPTDPRKRAAG